MSLIIELTQKGDSVYTITRYELIRANLIYIIFLLYNELKIQM